MLQGEADSVTDVAGGDFVVADQASKDGQAGIAFARRIGVDDR
jgi:hypothetical protein